MSGLSLASGSCFYFESEWRLGAGSWELGLDICVISLCLLSGVPLTPAIVLIISGWKLDISFIYESLRLMAGYSLQVFFIYISSRLCVVYCVMLYRNVRFSIFSIHIQTKRALLAWAGLPVSVCLTFTLEHRTVPDPFSPTFPLRTSVSRRRN